MIKEIIQFTQSLDEDFRNQGVKPKEGLHILLRIVKDGEKYRLDTSLYEPPICYASKASETPFLERCKFWTANAWCIDTNKCFDLPTKAIHTCSPYCVSFKREHIAGGAKHIANMQVKKKQIGERFGDYFAKAFELIELTTEKERVKVFETFFTQNDYISLLKQIELDFAQKRQDINSEIEGIKQQQVQEKEKQTKEALKQKIDALTLEKLYFKELEDSDYICFYLDEKVATYKHAHQIYLGEKLFNTTQYNEKIEDEVFGTSGFFNSYNSNMPFLMHQTATFAIAGRISSLEATELYNFGQILPRKILPNPLPIFVFADEREKSIGLFKESGGKKGYKEVITDLWTTIGNELGNYYLLSYANTKDGLIFQDFDFVSKFEYKLGWTVENLFDLKEKGSRELKHYPSIDNVFDLEARVFTLLLSDKYNKLDYFNDLDSAKYDSSQRTFTVYTKYRKSVYDYVYKSQRHVIQSQNFTEMIFEGIKDDIKNDKAYTIKEKLNIWFNLLEKFNLNPPNITMSSQLKIYQQFVDEVALEKANLDGTTDEQFAFAAGQVIDYVLGKSKSQDKSYRLLEPYLQQAKCSEFLKSLSIDIARYKHEIQGFEQRFTRVSAFVLTYQTDISIKNLLPQILAGVFAKSQLYGSGKEKDTQESN